MSGHSKWATTKHKKAVIDARRGKLFAKLIKNVEVAARSGGPDPAGNPTLYDAVQKAKKNSVPSDNIDRAIRRGAGLEAGGAAYETSFIEYWFTRLLYYDAPAWVFIAAYTLFGLAVAAAWWRFPPRSARGGRA